MEVLLQQAVPAHDGHLKSGAKSKQRNRGVVGLTAVSDAVPGTFL